MPEITDEQAWEIFRLWEDGASRQEIADHVGYPVRRIFDRNCEQRRRGTLLHPSLSQLPRHQGRGGGRPWHAAEATRAEIEARTAEIRAQKQARELRVGD